MNWYFFLVYFGWHQVENFKNLRFWISRNFLSGVFLVQEACHLYHLFSYQVSCFHACFIISNSNIAVILKGQKI